MAIITTFMASPGFRQTRRHLAPIQPVAEPDMGVPAEHEGRSLRFLAEIEPSDDSGSAIATGSVAG